MSKGYTDLDNVITDIVKEAGELNALCGAKTAIIFDTGEDEYKKKTVLKMKKLFTLKKIELKEEQLCEELLKEKQKNMQEENDLSLEELRRLSAICNKTLEEVRVAYAKAHPDVVKRP